MAAFLIIDDAGQQIIGEVALFQFLDLLEHQRLHLIEALALFRSTQQ